MMMYIAMLLEAPILHPGASFRNLEAGFQISEVRSRGSFHGESAWSGVPRVEPSGAGASCNYGQDNLDFGGGRTMGHCGESRSTSYRCSAHG
jgi:hypothetical protein